MRERSGFCFKNPIRCATSACFSNDALIGSCVISNRFQAASSTSAFNPFVVSALISPLSNFFASSGCSLIHLVKSTCAAMNLLSRSGFSLRNFTLLTRCVVTYLPPVSVWKETGGKYVTTHLVSSVKFLKEKPDLLKRFIAAHVDLTRWINEHPDEAKKLLNGEIKAETTKGLKAEVLDAAWKRLEITHDPISASLLKSAEDAHRIGFLKQKPDLSRIYDLKLLHEVLKERIPWDAIDIWKNRNP